MGGRFVDPRSQTGYDEPEVAGHLVGGRSGCLGQPAALDLAYGERPEAVDQRVVGRSSARAASARGRAALRR